VANASKELETLVLERILIKKTAILLFTLLLLAGLGIVVYHYMTIPRQEGIAHLKPAKMELYSPSSANSTSYAVSKKNRPETLLDLPKDISETNENVHFFSLPVGKNNVFVIIQKNAPNQANAWIDTNLDRCLSDEKAISGTIKKYSKHRTNTWEYFDFGNIQLKSENFTSAPFHFTCHRSAGSIHIEPVSCMKGKIRLGNRIYKLTFVDGDFDGKIKTAYSYSENPNYWRSDTLYFTEKNRSWLWKNNELGQTIPFGKYFKSYHEYFSIDLSEDGTKLQMMPVEPAMGTLKIANYKSLRASLFSDTASQFIYLEDEIKLPTGKYQIGFGWLQYADDTGHNWTFWPNFREDIRKGLFEIKEGHVSTLNPGPPFRIISDVTKLGNDKLSINAGLVGNEGEEYGLLLYKNNKKSKEPRLSIIDEKNNIIESGKMEYG
jgi:hypothetical protein